MVACMRPRRSPGRTAAAGRARVGGARVLRERAKTVLGTVQNASRREWPVPDSLLDGETWRGREDAVVLATGATLDPSSDAIHSLSGEEWRRRRGPPPPGLAIADRRCGVLARGDCADGAEAEGNGFATRWHLDRLTRLRPTTGRSRPGVPSLRRGQCLRPRREGVRDRRGSRGTRRLADSGARRPVPRGGQTSPSDIPAASSPITRIIGRRWRGGPTPRRDGPPGPGSRGPETCGSPRNGRRHGAATVPIVSRGWDSGARRPECSPR